MYETASTGTVTTLLGWHFLIFLCVALCIFIAYSEVIKSKNSEKNVNWKVPNGQKSKLKKGNNDGNNLAFKNFPVL